MIEILALGLLIAPVFASLSRDANQHYRRVQEARNWKQPGLSSQRSQIKPLSPAAIELGKKAYLGPKRERKVQLPKRLRNRS